MQDIVKGIISLHSLNPPLAHRDIKIENVLLNNRNFKLCDFGSSSSKKYDISKVNKSDYHIYEEEFERYTTPMYRPPEMCDLFL